MMRTSASLWVLCGLVAVLCIVSAVPCAGRQVGSRAPINPAFVAHLNDGEIAATSTSGPEESQTDYNYGLIPEPTVLPRVTKMRALDSGPLPATYDLRTLGKLPPIRSQGSCGACWAFAACASMESTLMPGEVWDFSENNLKNLHGYDVDSCSGGNRRMATAYLARWGGPVTEADDPYGSSGNPSPSGLIARKHVQDVIFVQSRASSLDNDAIKQAVMTYGAVYASYYHTDSSYNSTTKSYYHSTSTTSNHAICIVGWNDNFDKNSFSTAPSGNGAFIARNSWGQWWGESGYFYISYYDANLAYTDVAAFNGIESTFNHARAYGYDTLGWTGSYGFGTTTGWFAMIFSPTESGTLAAAGWYTPSPGSSYELRVYENPRANDPTSGTKRTTKTGTIADAGYHTINLDTGVPVTAGTTYSVVVKLTTPGYNYPISYEHPMAGYSGSATANNGETFMGRSNVQGTDAQSWYDVAEQEPNASVCLKAFVRLPGNISVTPAEDASFLGGTGGPFAPAGKTYMLANTGNMSVNWTASATQTWMSLSTGSGVLVPGATVDVVLATSVGAGSLLSGAYSGSVSFTNTTNGAGSTSRDAGLLIGQSMASVSALKSTTDGGMIFLADRVVTAVFGDCIYVQDPSRTSGIRVAWTGTGIVVGDIVDVVGILSTYTPDGVFPTERQIVAMSVVSDN